METMAWNDEKIDTLAVEVHDGFARAKVEYARTDERFRRIDERFDDAELRSAERFKAFDQVAGRRFDEIERRLDGVQAGLERLDDRFDAFHRTFVQICGGLIGTLFLALVTVIATH